MAKKQQQLKILIVDDSIFVANALKKIIEKDELIKVIGIVHSGEEVVANLDKFSPDLITMDLQMPGIGGIETIKQIIKNKPYPILVITGEVKDSRDSDLVFKAMQAGALDLIPKPKLIDDDSIEHRILREKIKILSRVKVTDTLKMYKPKKELDTERFRFPLSEFFKIIGIVSSTGGPRALCSILQQLPQHFSAPIIIVQHLARGFSKQLATWLQHDSTLEIKIAEHRERLRSGVVYIAPDDKQCRISSKLEIRLENGDADKDDHIPSGNVMLTSLAKIFKDRSIGVILTGMGSDGAKGAKEIKEIGGEIIVQDEESSVIFGMPRNAIDCHAANYVMNLADIPYKLMTLVGMQTSSGRSPDST